MSTNALNHNSTSPEVLLGILSTLHRLEALLENHSYRLNTIEKSSRPYLGASRPRQEPDFSLPVPSPSQYVESVLKLQTFFNSDSRPGLDLYDEAAPAPDGHTSTAGSAPEGDGLMEPAAHDPHMEGDEGRSMSIYSSRPLSRLDLEWEVPDVPQLPHEYRDSVGLASTGPSSRLRDGSFSSTQDGAGTPVSETRSGGSRSFWRRHGSARGSIETNITVPSVGTKGSSRKQSLEAVFDTNGSRRRLSGSIRAVLRRSVSLGRPKCASVSGPEAEEWLSDSTELRDDREPHEHKPVWFLYGVRNIVAKTMMSCVRWPCGVFVATGRAMVNQQLKMLDVAS